MKKLALFIMLSTLIFAGCTQGISQSEYDALLVENQALQEEITTLKTEPEMVEAILTGGFTATFRGAIPDYVRDGTTLSVAILTPFQNGPYVVYIGEEMAKELVVDEQYYFVIEDKKVGEIPREIFEKGNTPESGAGFTEELLAQYNLRIVAYREPKESEWGVVSAMIHYKETE